MYYERNNRKSNITLYQGDNEFFLEDILKNNNIILVIDPPFNINYHYNEYKDNRKDYYDWLDKLISNFDKKVLIHYPEEMFNISLKMKETPDKVISWVYNSNLPRQHRMIAYFGVKPNLNQVRQPYKNINDKRIKKRLKDGKKGSRMYDWFYQDQVKNVNKEKQNHPAQMPLEVMKRVIGVLPKNSIIVDIFMGSGTTGVACKDLGYDFIGVELNKEYFEIAKKELKNIYQIIIYGI